MKRQDRVADRTKRMTVSAMLAALGVALMWLGSLFDTLSLSMAAIASMLTIFAVIDIGSYYPYLIYAVTSVVALLLLPVKDVAVYYACFFGIYPILKEKYEKRSRPTSWLLKIATFNLAMILVAVITYFLLSFDKEDIKAWYLVAIAVLGNITFFLYDFALTRLITLYIRRFREHFRFLRRK